MFKYVVFDRSARCDSMMVNTIRTLNAASRGLAKDAAEVSAADFADILRRKALKQHLPDNRREKSSSQARIRLVRALALTRRKQICVSADTRVVDAHRVHHRLD